MPPVRSGLSLVAVISAPLAALGRRGPCVVGVQELSPGQIVEALLFLAKYLQLMRTLVRLHLCGVDGLGLSWGSCFAPTEQPAQESHTTMLREAAAADVGQHLANVV